MANEYSQYLNKIKEIFNNDQHYQRTMHAITEGKVNMSIDQTFNKKVFDMEWIDVIEDCLPSLDHIVRNPRKFIVIEEDILDISLARNISPESVRHLAQHTNFIASVDEKKGTVTPSKILNTAKEESFDVYENRFAYTLIKKLNDFVDKRYKELEQAIVNESSEMTINIDSEYKYNGSTMRVELKATTNMPFEKFSESNINLNPGATEGMTPLQRVSRMHQIVTGFLGSPFAKSMRQSAPVRPPITRTNVIKKEPNFKKALILWQFIESYDKKGFEIEKVNEHSPLPQSLDEQYRHILFLNDLILENLANLHTDEQTLEELDEKVKQEELSAQKERIKEIEKEVEKESASKEDESSKDKSEEEKKIDEELEQENKLDEDEFPSINLDLREVRKVYSKVKDDKTYTPTEYREITAALDRVIAQHNINQSKRDKKLQEKLIKAQKKEEERVRIKNRNDKKRELERRKKEAADKILAEEKAKQQALREENRRLREERQRRREEEQAELARLLEQKKFEEEIGKYAEFVKSQMDEETSRLQDELDSLNKENIDSEENEFNKYALSYKAEALAKFESLLDEQISKVDLKNIVLTKSTKNDKEPKNDIINLVHNENAAVDILLSLSNK